MRNSKKQVILAISFCLLTLLCVWILNYLLVPYSSLDKKFDAYRRAEAKGNIDVLVVGSSLEGDGVDPKVLGNELGLHTFTFAPQGGYPQSSYDLLLLTAKRNKLKAVVVGWDLLQNHQSPAYVYPHEEEIYRSLLPYTNNKPLLLQILAGIARQRYTNSFFTYASFPENATKIPEVRASWKPAPPKASYTGPGIDVRHLLDKKDPYNYRQATGRSYVSEPQASDIAYLKRIKQLCDEQQIKLYLLLCPLPQVSIDGIPMVHELVDATESMAKGLDIPLINGFDFPDATNNSHFKDCFGHLLSPYREFYSRQIGSIIKQSL